MRIKVNLNDTDMLYNSLINKFTKFVVIDLIYIKYLQAIMSFLFWLL